MTVCPLALALPGFSTQFRRWRNIEAAGLSHEVTVIRDALLFNQPHSYTARSSASSDTVAVEEDLVATMEEWLDPEDNRYVTWLQTLDPVKWKDQDHYRCLGLTKLRYACSSDQLRLAFRQKVLRHHPDKRKANGAADIDNKSDYFAAITKAYETLSNKSTRRAFDSVDPTVDDSIPSCSADDFDSFDEFEEEFSAVFTRNARWSKVKPVPLLGTDEATFDEVDSFYAFWFDFQSWREYSYLDEEDKEKGECREERRWIEKQNKVQREKRKKDEVKRIRKLVEMAYASDPRIRRFKEEEKKRKQDEKDRKQKHAMERKAEEERSRLEAVEQERRRREEEERLVKEEKQARKRELERSRKERRELERRVEAALEQENYFCQGNETIRLKNMHDCALTLQSLSTERLAELAEQMSADVWETAVQEVRRTLAAETAVVNGSVANGDTNTAASKRAQWTAEESRILLKAMTLIPVGTKARWDSIAAFINEKAGLQDGQTKTGKDVIARVKQGFAASADATQDAQLMQSKKATVAMEQLSQDISVRGRNDEATVWSAEEQKVFEQALKTYGPKEAQRWERIAECLPGKTRKECVSRYKELAELVKLKKAAQLKAGT